MTYVWAYLAGLASIPVLWLLTILCQALYWGTYDAWLVMRGGLARGYGWWTWLWAAPAMVFVHTVRYLIYRANGIQRVRS